MSGWGSSFVAHPGMKWSRKCEKPKSVLSKLSRHDLLRVIYALATFATHWRGSVVLSRTKGLVRFCVFFSSSGCALIYRCFCMTSTPKASFLDDPVQLVKLADLAALFWAKFSTVGTLFNKLWHVWQKSLLWTDFFFLVRKLGKVMFQLSQVWITIWGTWCCCSWRDFRPK